MGLSLGGMIGQMLAVRHADRIAALALCDTTMRNRRSMWEERIAAIEADGLEPQVEPSISRWFTSEFTAARPALVDELRQMIRTTSISGYLGCAMAMRDMRLAEMVAQISMPTLVVVGADDRSTPVVDAQELHAAIPGAQLGIIAQAAHLPNIERAEQFNALLEPFLTAPPVQRAHRSETVTASADRHSPPRSAP